MRKFINRNLSVLLSFAIILCTIIPAISSVVKAVNYTEEDIAALKTAWENLTIETYFIPDKVWSSFEVETTGLNLADTSTYTGSDLTDLSVLGPKYATYTSVSDGGASTYDNYILFSAQENSPFFALEKLKGFSVYVKAPGFAARPKLNFENGEVKFWNASFYNNSQFGGNSWSEIKMSDLPQQENLWTLGERNISVDNSAITALGFDLSGTGSVALGSAKMTFATADKDTLELASTNAEAFKGAAMDFYFEAVSNAWFNSDDAKFLEFKNAVAKFTDDIEQQVKNHELKQAWAALPGQKLEFAPHTYVDSDDQDGETLTIYNSSSYEGNDIEKSLLGSQYATFTVNDTSASNSDNYLLFEQPENLFNKNDLVDYSVYIKSDADGIIARPRLCLANTQQLLNYACCYTGNNIGSGEWKQLKASDLASLGTLWEGYKENNEPDDAPIVAFGFDFSGSGNITVGTLVAEFKVVSDEVLALSNTDTAAFITAAEEFYEKAVEGGYYLEDNAEFIRFSNALTAAIGEPTIQKLAPKLAKAWKNLTVTETLIPTTLWSKPNEDADGFNLYDSLAYDGTDLNDTSVLGPKYATFTVVPTQNGMSTSSDSANYLIFKRADGKETPFNVGKFQSFSVYIKSATGDVARPIFHLSKDTAVNYPSYFDAATLTDRWTEIGTHNILKPSDFKKCYEEFSDQNFVGFGVDFAGVGDVTIGSMKVVFSAVDDETLALIDTDIVTFISEALYFYDNAVLNNSFDESDANFAKFKQYIEQIGVIDTDKEIFATANLRASWKSLDAQTLPNEDTSNWTIADWVYAASRIDASEYENKEKFLMALNEASAVRDELNMGVSCNFSSFPTYADAENALLTLSGNILSGKAPAVNYYNGASVDRLTAPTVEALNDGSYDTALSLSELDFSADGSYIELVYEFDGAAEIQNFFVGLSDNADLAKLNYRIYTANDIDKLSLSESIVASCDNVNGHQIQQFNYEGKLNISCSYIAFRFYGGANGININELSAYGKVTTYTVTTGSFKDADMEALGYNLLSGSNVSAYIRSGSTARIRWAEAGTGYSVKNLTDGCNDTGVGFGQVANMVVFKEGEEVSLHIIFDLKDTYYLEKLYMNHWYQQYLETGLYEIYASTELVTLNKSENKIIEYNNMSDGENGTTLTQLFTAKGKGKIARFVDFHIRVPVSDYEKAITKYHPYCYTRLRDVGVYGTKYIKPYADINFLPHVPVDVYRTDAAGNRASISETEYGYDEYAYAFDGRYEVAVPIDQKSKNLDFVFNLCADKLIKEIKLSTLTNNMKGVKVYASNTVEGVWKENALVINHNGEALKEIFRAFAETSISARYIRFSILETVNGVFDPTEFEVIGGNLQEFIYMNLMEEKSDSATLWLEDKDRYYITNVHESANEYNSAWNSTAIYGMEKAFDNDIETVSDFYGGSHGKADGSGKETYSFLMDLGNLMAIDKIEFIAGSTPDYWPTKINFYFGNDEVALFGKDAVPVKTFGQKTDLEDPSFSYEFLPEIAQYVRIEVVESSHRYYDMHDYIATVVGEIQVKGLEIIGSTASEGVAASVTDSDTGIRVDVLALRDNDVYTTVQDISVIKREATAEEKSSLASQSAVFASYIYDIYLLDADGNIISDVEGRELKIYLPKTLFKGNEDAYVLARQYGEYVMVDSETVDDYYATIFDDPFDMSVALCEFADIEIPEEPSDMGNDLTDDEDDTDEDESVEEDDDDDKPKRKKKIKVVRKNNGDDFNYLWLIIGGIAAIIIAAGIVLFLILKKKKNNEEE